MQELWGLSRAGAYPILIESGLRTHLGSLLKPLVPDHQLVVVTDRNVWERYEGTIRSGCGEFEVEPVVLAPGEEAKSWAGIQRLIDHLIGLGVRRDSTIVALGGGAIGDVTGFAASILHRGCRYVQVPTTLVSQVDSSVGGKTAINTRHGKNQVGTFHAPVAILIDPLFLGTLPSRELRSGYAELLKIALINDPEFFDWLECNGQRCLALEPEFISTAITTAVRGKIEIVNDDELDSIGRRILLNFGHTFAHAVESQTKFKVTHGEAVGLGMALAFRLSTDLGYCPATESDRVCGHIGAVGLPISLADVRLSGDAKELCQHFKSDKKTSAGAPIFIMTSGIGKAFADPSLGVARVAQFLDRQ